jgi:hypothetical protein
MVKGLGVEVIGMQPWTKRRSGMNLAVEKRGRAMDYDGPRDAFKFHVPASRQTPPPT